MPLLEEEAPRDPFELFTRWFREAQEAGALQPDAMTLATAGLTLKDIDVKHLAFSQMPSALANGALDAALAVAPFTEIALRQNTVVPWIDPEAGFIKTADAEKELELSQKLQDAQNRGKPEFQ